MLSWMRSFAKSPFALALFALLGVALVVTLPNAFDGVSGGGFVSVGERQIHASDLTREVESQLERIREEQKQVVSPRDAAQRGLTQQLLDSLIYRNSVLAYADKIGVAASPTAVSNLLLGSPRFKDPLGRLDMAAVERFAVEEQKTTWRKLEKDIRDDITFGYVQNAALGGLTTPEVLMKPLLAYYGEQRTLNVARLTQKSIVEPKPPTPEEMKAYYDQNQDKFRQAERRRITVLSYSAKDYLDKVQVTDEQVKAEYDRRIKEFSGPESREVMQFAGKDRATVQTFIDTVKQGNSLEDAVKKVEGIDRVDLLVKPGDLTDPEYNKGVFGMPAGELRGPQKVGEAWYAVQIKTIIPGTPQPFEAVSTGLREGLRDDQANKLFNDSEESFYDMAGGTSLEEIAKNIGAPTIQLAAVDRNGQTETGASSSLLLSRADAAKALFTLAAGQMTDVIEGEIPDGLGGKIPSRYIFRLDEIVAPHVSPLTEVELEVRNAWMAQKVQEAADKSANNVVAAVKAGAPLAKAAAAEKMSILPAITINRAQQPAISPAVADAAFKLKQGEIAMIKGEGNEPWVVQVEKVEPVSAETAAMVRQQLGQQITQSLQSDVQDVFVRGIQAEVKPKTNDKAIQAYFDNLLKDEAQ